MEVDTMTETTPEKTDVTMLSSDELRKNLNLEPQEEAAEEEVKEPEKEPVKEEAKVEEPAKEPESNEELDKLKRRVEESDKFNARLATELGLLRKQNPIDYNKKVQEIRDKFFEDPVAAIQELKALENEVQYHNQQEQAQVIQQIVKGSRELLTKTAPDAEKMVPEMAKLLLEEDGEDPAWVEEFKRNPYFVRGQHVHPAVLYNLQKRITLKNELVTAKEEVERLTKENTELRGKPEKILKKIEDAAKKTHVNSGGASSTETTTTTTKPIHRMTMEELRQIRTG